jgi:hypothetical protein
MLGAKVHKKIAASTYHEPSHEPERLTDRHDYISKRRDK